MNISYDRETDIMMLELSRARIDHAEQSGPIIIHFSRQNKPVLLEILGASDFIAMTLKSSLRAKKEIIQTI